MKLEMQGDDVLMSMSCRMSLVQDDDFTQLASILVVEACVRHHMTREAIEVCAFAMVFEVVLMAQ